MKMTNSWLERLRSHCLVFNEPKFYLFMSICFAVDPLTGNIIGNFDAGIAPSVIDNKPVKGKQSFLDLVILHSVPTRES